MENKEKLIIDKNEVLRYLGYKNQSIDSSMEYKLLECINEMRSIQEAKITYGKFKLNKGSGKVALINSMAFLEGSDIVNHLKFSNDCILFAATLGSFVDKRIRFYEKTDMTKAVILDACAAAAIEEVCDSFMKSVSNKLNNKKLTERFSPGYGDFPLSFQKEFISILNADKIIGLTVSSYNILYPIKSVTAIIGIVDKSVSLKGKSCEKCSSFLSCKYRKGGGSCEI